MSDAAKLTGCFHRGVFAGVWRLLCVSQNLLVLGLDEGLAVRAAAEVAVDAAPGVAAVGVAVDKSL